MKSFPSLTMTVESNSNSRTKLKFNLWFVFYNNFLFARPYDIKLIPALGKINRIGRGLFELGYQEFDSEYAFLRTKDLNYSINALFAEKYEENIYFGSVVSEKAQSGTIKIATIKQLSYLKF